MSNQAKVCWNASYYGVEIHAGKRRFVVSAMPNMVGRLDTAVRCMETMSGWRLPTFKEVETIIGSIAQVNALMEQGMSRKDAIRQAAKDLDLPKNVVYDAALRAE